MRKLGQAWGKPGICGDWQCTRLSTGVLESRMQTEDLNREPSAAGTWDCQEGDLANKSITLKGQD